MAVDDGARSPAAARSVTRATATFKPRRRRLSPNRRADLERWMGERGIETTGALLDWVDVFGTDGDVTLDIGFGHGESVLDLARRRPDVGVVGVEVHTAGVTTVLEAAEREGLANVRVVHGDVLAFLDRVPAGSLSRIQVFFPDPWPKVKQVHRRLIAPDVVAALADRLQAGGVLRLATDDESYAEQMGAVCSAEPRLVGGVIPRPDDRPPTRFEQRARDEGREPVDLAFERVGS